MGTRDKKLMAKFDNYEKSLILGSNRRRDMFAKSGDVLKSAYLGNPMYINGAKNQKYIGYNVGMKRFYSKYPKNEFGFEVGKISIMLSEILLSKTRIATLSEETLSKNLKHHPDLKESDYLMLDYIIGKSHFIAKDGNRTVAVVLNAKNSEMYHYVLKSTQTGKALFLTSFGKTNKISIDKIRKKERQGKVKIIKDNLP